MILRRCKFACLAVPISACVSPFSECFHSSLSHSKNTVLTLNIICYFDKSWETGTPSAAAASARAARYANARTQMTSAFPPQKRLTLERKSPVTRLDINAPNFTEYKKTYPGLFKN